MLGLRPVRVCDACLERVQGSMPAADHLCSRCGDALGMESARFAAAMGMSECTTCRIHPPHFTRAVAFGVYDRELREILHALKFRGVRRMAHLVVGDWLATAIRQLEPQLRSQNVLLVPVPLSAKRLRKRGYNQSALLARSAQWHLRKSGWLMELRSDVLARVRETQPLHALRPDQRRRNLVGAFRVLDGEAVRGRDVVLVDDILTTGATANQCAAVLLKAGARAVWVATVARAQPESTFAVEPLVARWSSEALSETKHA